MLCVAVLLSPAAAAADPFVGIGLGPTIRLDHWPNQVRVEQSIGYSFEGRSGFFLSFAPYQSWSNSFWILSFPLGLGAHFDVFHNDDFTFQLGPMGTVGLALSNHFNDGRDVDPWFHVSFAFVLRLLLMDDRLGIYIKPAGFELAFGDSNRMHGEIDGRYFLTGGIQYYF